MTSHPKNVIAASIVAASIAFVLLLFIGSVAFAEEACPCTSPQIDSYVGPRMYFSFVSHVETGYTDDKGVFHNEDCFYDENGTKNFLALDAEANASFENGMTAIANLLEAHHAKGTFLIFPALAAKHPNVVKMLLARGHEVGTHTHTLAYNCSVPVNLGYREQIVPKSAVPQNAAQLITSFIKEKKKVLDDIIGKENDITCNVIDTRTLEQTGLMEDVLRGEVEAGCKIEEHKFEKDGQTYDVVGTSAGNMFGLYYYPFDLVAMKYYRYFIGAASYHTYEIFDKNGLRETDRQKIDAKLLCFDACVSKGFGEYATITQAVQKISTSNLTTGTFEEMPAVAPAFDFLPIAIGTTMAIIALVAALFVLRRKRRAVPAPVFPISPSAPV